MVFRRTRNHHVLRSLTDDSAFAEIRAYVEGKSWSAELGES